MKRRERSVLTAIGLTVGIAVLLAGTQAVEAGVTNLDTLNSLLTGDYSFTADSQTFNARVENIGGTGWLLVGRGREGWEFDNDGQGAVASVNQGLGTPAAFAPALYSDAIINNLIGNSGINLTGTEIRIRRAGGSAGIGPYQEARWRPITQTTWRGNFDTQYDVEYEVVSGFSSPLAPINTNTRDGGPNDFRRIFTWAWGNHGNQKGFNFGNVTADGANNATSFWWENGNENHAIPYTEVYIRPLVGGPSRFEIGGDNTIGINTLIGTQGNEVADPGVDGARVVKIIQNKPTASNPLMLGEVQAIETGTLANVALGGTATQSTQLGGYAPGLAIDNNLGNFTHTNDGQGQWWQVDLGAQKDLDKLTIYSRNGCCNQGRTADIQVQVFGDAAMTNLLFDQQVLGIGTSDVRDVPLTTLVSADLTATLLDAATYVFELGSNDQLTIANPDPSVFTTVLDLNEATLELELLNGPMGPGYYSWDILDVDEILGDFDQIILPQYGDHVWDTSQVRVDGTVSLVVPEPATMALLGLAACGLGGYVRRRRMA